MRVVIAVDTPVDTMKSEDTMTGEVADNSASSLEHNTEDGHVSTAQAQIENGKPSIATETGAEEQADIGPALYPPVLENVQVLEYIKDKNGIDYARDIGCSTTIHDEVYFIFGETLCKDAAGKVVGTTSNTIAYVEDRANFLQSEYGEIYENGTVKAFVPLDEQETRFEKDNPNARIVFRMFGGAVDVGAVGVVWFQNLIMYANGEEDYRGVGQARLTTYSDGRIVVQRLKALLFGPDEPRMGSFSTLLYDGYVYLWSHLPDGQIILARVYRLETVLCHRYEYWSGTDWVHHWRDAQPVLHGIQHGAIVYTHLFGKDKPFLFVGVNKQADSMVQIGAAAEVQGPFDLTAVCKAAGTDDDEKLKYCIYPHLFASNVPKRELVVTWSEYPPGGVIAAKLKFKIDEVAAIKEAEERKRAAEEQEARRLARMAEEEEAKDGFWYESEGSNYPTPRRDRSE